VLLGADATQGNSLLAYLPFVLIAAGLYFVLIRPQSKRRKQAMSMQTSLGPGDEVQTVGGLYGTVTDVDDESVTLEASPGVHLRFAKGAIAKINRSVAAETVTDDGPADDGNSDARKAVDQD
jgi:preprotein translocase subunit YajC